MIELPIDLSELMMDGPSQENLADDRLKAPVEARVYLEDDERLKDALLRSAEESGGRMSAPRPGRRGGGSPFAARESVTPRARAAAGGRA